MPWIPRKSALKRIREQKGHTVWTLAAQAGMSERQIRKIESESPPGSIFGSNLYALTRVLGCDREDLATWTEKRPRRKQELAPVEPQPRRRSGDFVKPRNLTELADLERRTRTQEGFIPEQVATANGTFPLLSAELYAECHTHFGAYDDQRFIVIGHIEQHKPLSPLAAKVLKTESGVGGRFQLGRDILYGVPLMVTVTTTTGEHTRAMLELARADCAATVLARLQVARPSGHWQGFAPLEGEGQIPFAFVVEAVLDSPE